MGRKKTKARKRFRGRWIPGEHCLIKGQEEKGDWEERERRERKRGEGGRVGGAFSEREEGSEVCTP